MTPAITPVQVGPFPSIPVLRKGSFVFTLASLALAMRPDAPKKPSIQVPSPMKEAAERFTSERLAALIQFQPKKEAV